MSGNLEILKKKLAELFQLDQADLDFGIYRIMNAKRDEVTQFLEKDLLPQVKEAFKEFKPSDKAEIQKELNTVIESVKAAGMNPEDAPKVKELRARLKEDAVDLTALENEVYSRLFDFFNRYYDGGDFMSLRRYKEGVYAIPYEGEEVKLHWANADQYYIKSAEYFRNYIFKVSGGKRVHFKLTEADTEKDNIKAANGKDRRFFLVKDNVVSVENDELFIRFEYRTDSDKKKQDAINAESIQKILEGLKSGELAEWHSKLTAKVPTDKNPNRTILEKHLSDYTQRNNFDFFIHKDLGRFLSRELDFYIKNEVMHLDDVENESAPRVEQYLSKIKVIRKIAHKIIEFLAQLEDFQKKLWLKKKFVVETNYCITLDRVPEDLYEEIVSNDAQREEWVKLFAINEIKKDTTGAADYSKPLTKKFLKANPFLVLDTKFFNIEFKTKLTASIENIDDNCDGLLINSENLQALNILQERYHKQLKCVYIDPPYNTDASPIIYKNSYKSSTWATLMYDRLQMTRQILADDGVLVTAIDDEQQKELSYLLDSVFSGNVLGTICVRSNPSGRPTQTGYSVSHEYLIFAGQSAQSGIGRLPPTPEQVARFNQRDENGAFEWRNLRREGSNSDRAARRALYYPIYIMGESIRVPAMTWYAEMETWNIDEKPKPEEQVAYPDNEHGAQKTWRWEWKTVMASLSELAVRKDRSGRDYIYYKRRPNDAGVVSVSSWFDAKYSATEHGTAVLKALFSKSPFSYPKSIYAVLDAIYISGGSEKNTTILDYFGGSGTTGHAVVKLNCADGGKRKYILVEMGDYFDTVLKPRIQKVVYSKDWKDGKPVSREGSSHMFKYIRLESYEDALANLELKRTDEQQKALELSDSFKESYMLSYMLDVETKDSPSLLNINSFDDPFSYKLLVGTGSVGETKEVNVDLVETFNWLIGLRVRHMDSIRGFHIVEGMNPNDEKVLIIWRKIRDLSEADPEKTKTLREKANSELEEFFQKQHYNTMDMEFDIIYTNGDNNLMNLPMKTAEGEQEPRYKVRLIEEEFKRLMFDVKDV